MESESLIMAERQHLDKDLNVAQKIHSECDKQFTHEDAVAADHVEEIVNGINAHHDGETPNSEEAEDAKDELVDSLNGHVPVTVAQDQVNPVGSEEDAIAPAADEQTPEDIVAEDIQHQHHPSINNVSEKSEEEDEPVANKNTEQNDELRRIQREEKIVKPRRIFEEEIKPPMEPLPVGPRKGAIPTSMDADNVRDAYNDIRDDNSDTKWAVFKYDATRIICSAKGISFEDFKEQFNDNERAYGYIRLQTGDEMSKRHKFLFVTWIGPGVNVIKRAKMSIDKAIIKHVVSNFAVELQLESLSEFDLPFFIESLNKASGANYGTGIRDI